jgi:assimilatory nitrate reductase catalytic subunit
MAVAQLYHWFATTERVVTLFSQGVNQSSSGTDKVNSIVDCHLATGRIGSPGMGPFSLTGQPNAMGGREVGGLANTLAAHMDFGAEACDRVERFWGAPAIARAPGLKAVDLFQAVGEERIQAVWIMATNPAVSLPDAFAAHRALQRCGLVVVSDCVRRTDTADRADVLLPAATWGEIDGTVTNSERCISRQRPFMRPPGEARPDWWIITQVAHRMGFADAFPYRGPAGIFREHAAFSTFENAGARAFNIGGLAAVDDDAYDTMTPIQWPVPAGRRQGTPTPVRQPAVRPPDHRGRFAASSLGYWVSVRGHHFWRYELAGVAKPDDWSMWATCLMGGTAGCSSTRSRRPGVTAPRASPTTDWWRVCSHHRITTCRPGRGWHASSPMTA